MHVEAITIVGVPNFEWARLHALKRAGYNIDLAVPTDEKTGKPILDSSDRKHFNRIVRYRHSKIRKGSKRGLVQHRFQIETKRELSNA